MKWSCNTWYSDIVTKKYPVSDMEIYVSMAHIHPRGLSVLKASLCIDLKSQQTRWGGFTEMIAWSISSKQYAIMILRNIFVIHPCMLVCRGNKRKCWHQQSKKKNRLTKESETKKKNSTMSKHILVKVSSIGYYRTMSIWYHPQWHNTKKSLSRPQLIGGEYLSKTGDPPENTLFGRDISKRKYNWNRCSLLFASYKM